MSWDRGAGNGLMIPRAAKRRHLYRTTRSEAKPPIQFDGPPVFGPDVQKRLLVALAHPRDKRRDEGCRIALTLIIRMGANMDRRRSRHQDERLAACPSLFTVQTVPSLAWPDHLQSS